jgi:hypothetical protein
MIKVNDLQTFVVLDSFQQIIFSKLFLAVVYWLVSLQSSHYFC